MKAISKSESVDDPAYSHLGRCIRLADAPHHPPPSNEKRPSQLSRECREGLRPRSRQSPDSTRMNWPNAGAFFGGAPHPRPPARQRAAFYQGT
jgi:hypothetical protein